LVQTGILSQSLFFPGGKGTIFGRPGGRVVVAGRQAMASGKSVAGQPGQVEQLLAASLALAAAPCRAAPIQCFPLAVVS